MDAGVIADGAETGCVVVVVVGTRRRIPRTLLSPLSSNSRPRSIPLPRVALPLGHLVVDAVLVWGWVRGCLTQEEPLGVADGNSGLLLEGVLVLGGHRVVGAWADERSHQRRRRRIKRTRGECLTRLPYSCSLRIFSWPRADILGDLGQEEAVLLRLLLDVEFWTTGEF